MLTRRELRQLFDLNCETGELIWKRLPVHLAGRLKGTVAGQLHAFGHIVIHINGKYYPRAHLVYQYDAYGGAYPSEVHHINGILTDDRPKNLRRLLDFPDTKITQKYLKKAFELNYSTGELFRKVEEQGRVVLENRPAGALSRALSPDGRWEISVLGQLVRRHRLVYLYVHGKMPPEQINHVNGDLTDDRPENLRPVTISQRRMSSRGKVGRELPKGVTQQTRKANKPFYARIKLDGQRYYLGSFETVEEAAAAYDAAAKNLFGEFARPNNPLQL